jgi:hypothetical protein
VAYATYAAYVASLRAFAMGKQLLGANWQRKNRL